MGLRAKIHREKPAEQIGVLPPQGGDLRGQRRRRPRVHHVRVAGEASGDAALLRREPRRDVLLRVDRERSFIGEERILVAREPAFVQPVPHGERDPEEPLTADAPVLVQVRHPGAVAGLHVRGMPRQLLTARDQPLLETEDRHEPLTTGDDLERSFPLLVELHGVSDRLRLTEERARLSKHLDGSAAGLLDRASGESRHRGVRGTGIARLPSRSTERARADGAVLLDHDAQGQVELAPPCDVGEIAERADHRDARALLGIRQLVNDHGHGHAEQRREDGGPHERRVPRVPRVRDERHASREELGPRGLDLHGRPVLAIERDAMVEAVLLAILDLCLRDRRVEVDVPHRGGFRRVRDTLRDEMQEGPLGDATGPLADRRIGVVPVDRPTRAAEQVLERLLIRNGEPVAEVDEVPTADADGLVLVGPLQGGDVERGNVREQRIAANAEVVLHSPLRREAVVVPPDRVEDLLAAHPLVASDQVGVRVRHHVPDVEAAAHGGWRCVDREDLVAGPRPVEAVGTGGLPPLPPLRFQAVERRLLRNLHARECSEQRTEHRHRLRPWRHASRAGPRTLLVLASARHAAARS